MATLQERFALVFPPPHRRGLLADIARTCSVSSPTVTAWFSKPEKVASIERANAEKICAAFARTISPAWLAEGTGDMHVSSLRDLAPPPSPGRDFSDRREVSPSEWGLLQDVMLVMTDQERAAIRDRAERTRRIAAEQLAEVAEMSAPKSPTRRFTDRLPKNLGAPIQSDYDQPDRRKQGGE